MNKADYNKRAQATEEGIATYATTKKDLTGRSTEGGEQTNYALNGKVLMIDQVFGGETGKSEVRYYIENGKVFYFKRNNYEYEVPLSVSTSGKIKSIEVKEFYLGSDQSLCSWLDNGKVQQNDQDTKELVSYLIAGLR